MKKTKTGTLVLVRHGESRFNELNLFTGWLDVPLTEKGIAEAIEVAKHCRKYNYDAVFTSHLERAHETLLIMLADQKKIGVFQHTGDKRYNQIIKATRKHERLVPVFTSRALNERAYGDLQGMNRDDAVARYGKEQLVGWRRGYADRPPNGESLEDVYQRTVLYFTKLILSRLKRGQVVLMVGHGNTFRALIKFLEHISDEQIPRIYLPFAEPITYEYVDGTFARTAGSYNFERGL